VVKALNRKLLREMVGLRGQLFSIALVVAAGVMAVVTMQSTFQSLERSRDDYYREYRYAHVFASLERAPESLSRRIAALPGVAAAETRVIKDVVITVPGLTQVATGHLVSVPESHSPQLNGLHLRAGRWVAPGRDDEVMVSERFAAANRLAPGATVGAVVNGRQRVLRIVGVALSPEYVYEMAPAAGFLTDKRLYGVFWMGREALAAAADMTGAFNDVALRLAPGASEQAVIEQLDRVLEPWGGRGAYGRADQISNRILTEELKQNETTALIVPAVFLSIAAFLLHMVMLRLVATQREQIALLKAFGYRHRDIALHYLWLALFAVAGGAVLGVLAGLWLGSGYTRLYGEFFFFPELSYRATPGVALFAIAIASLAALTGALSAVRHAAALEPAVGMRAESPARFRPLLLERVGLHRWLSPQQRMVLRNVERRPVRSLMAAVGVGFALSMYLVGNIMMDSMYAMISGQFESIQREDVAVAFDHARDARALRELARIPGVIRAEPYHVVPVEMSNGARRRRLAITGLAADAQLRRMTDGSLASHPLPEDGLVITRRLAHILDVVPGDSVQLELLDRSEERVAVVAATMDELLGMNAYAEISALRRMLREGTLISGAYLDIERGAESEVFRHLQELPGVASTLSKAAMLESFEDQMAESMTITTTILITLAAVLAVGVIYNGARIALSERGRELASLRVLGFNRQEVGSMLLGEQALVTAVGLPLGGLIGYGVTVLIMAAYDTELYRIPVVFRAGTFMQTALVVALIAAAAGLLVRRRLDRADLIAVLKTRE
jgi:putative ABC transport system permease protein